MIERLRQRAAALARARDFFAARGVLEVQTAVLGRRTVSDPNIDSLRVPLDDGSVRWLQTSPEYAMKRLLAEGSGDIYQIGPVFRAGEVSARHNPEFTLIEWYRLGFTLDAIMDDTAALAALLLEPRPIDPMPERVSYCDAFEQLLDLDPLEAPREALAAASRAAGLATSSIATASRDDLLDFLVATCVGPRLGHGRLCCLHHYPASQAALARVDPQDPRTALRFELYCEGVELANGFVELGDAREQARRFAADNDARRASGRETIAPDERLLAALERGLPDCAGVALGFERLLMLASGADRIGAVLALPDDAG